MNFSRVKSLGKEAYVLTVHLNGTLQNEDLTKQTLQRILQGDPPLYEDPREGDIPSIRKDNANDIKRGGWVAALGFEGGWTTDSHVEALFVPLYEEVEVEGYPRRGGIFWRSIDRIKEIIENRLQPSFPSSRNTIQRTVDAIKLMKSPGTDTGVREMFPEVDKRFTFSDRDRRNIIALFNGSNQLSPIDTATLRVQFEPSIDRVLVAAVRGAMYCVAYVKNQGRELNRLLSDFESTPRV